MTKPQQVLQLEPNTELVFKGPFTEYVTSNLRLTNPSQKSVFFKVKTTAPRFYCVRPNSGVIKPAESTVINVMLQPIDQNSVAENERARHKFMIQTAFAPDDGVPLDAFWKTVDPSEIMDSKLRVVFLCATGEPIESPARDVTVGPDGAASAAAVKAAPHNTNISSTDNSASFAKASGSNTGNRLNETLQKEIELRKMYQDEKNKLERENADLLEKLELATSGVVGNSEGGLPFLHVIMISILVLLIGIILGKLI